MYTWQRECAPSMKNILIYSDTLSTFAYGAYHPYKPERARQFKELAARYGLLYEANQEIVEPKPLDEELLYLFHDRDYIDLLKASERGAPTVEMLEAGLGSPDNPIIPGMYEFALLAAGGTLLGAQLLDEDAARFVFNPSGGFHHAGRAHAEGFCYINDIGVTIEHLIRRGRRVAYIDIDVHHGNGVQDAFYDSDRVLTISIHESGVSLYPWSGFENEIGEGAGRGYNVNVPLLPETDDHAYWYAFESVVPPLVTRFAPDIVFAEIGGDLHRDDPLANLNITTEVWCRAVGAINALAPRIMALGGGGYNPHKTAALWALAWAIFCGLTPSDSYAGIVGGMMYGPEAQAGSLHDEPSAAESCALKPARHAHDVVRHIRETVFPLHGIAA